MAVGEFDLTTLSALSIGWDPARGDSTPRERTAGPYLSVGTGGQGVVGIFSSVVSVDPASLTAGSASTLTVALPGVKEDSMVIAHPISSLWSAEYLRLNHVAYGLADGVVEIGFSNTTGATVNAVELNWRVTAIDF